jgi:hypothetical protein
VKIKLDANLGERGRRILASAGHDVCTVPAQALSSADDRHLIEACRREERALVTLDMDCANPLVYPPADYPGIAVIRIPKRARPQGDGDPDADDLESDEATEGPVLGLEDVVSVTLAGKTTAAALTVGDICWIESLRNSTRVALKGPPRVVLFRRRLSEWDECLPGEHFARVGRSCIVQLSTIDQIEWKSRAETTVTFGAGVEPLALGRLPATRLREILGSQG